jgi:DNA-binding SARP family transcriptional activator
VESTRHVNVLGALGVRPHDHFAGTGRRLLAHLAVYGPRELRSIIYADLWSEVPEQRARANLRRALWQLPEGWVLADGPDLILDAAIDLQEARTVADRAVRDGTMSWDEVNLVSRDILPGWCEDWVVSEQESFHLLRTQALEATCRRAAAQRDFTLATHAGLRAVKSDPLRESAVEALVEATMYEGNRCLALRHYQTFADMLVKELQASPGQRLQLLISAMLGHSPPVDPP